MKYYVLKDLERRGTVVRSESGKSFKYDKERGWVRSGLMSQYFFPESPIYESYDEISEDEANKLIANM
jgi:hypothetical protein